MKTFYMCGSITFHCILLYILTILRETDNRHSWDSYPFKRFENPNEFQTMEYLNESYNVCILDRSLSTISVYT